MDIIIGTTSITLDQALKNGNISDVDLINNSGEVFDRSIGLLNNSDLPGRTEAYISINFFDGPAEDGKGFVIKPGGFVRIDKRNNFSAIQLISDQPSVRVGVGLDNGGSLEN